MKNKRKFSQNTTIVNKEEKKSLCKFCFKKRVLLTLFIEYGLTTKHRSSQNFYYIREINDICFQRISFYNIRFTENRINDEEKENLKRFYAKYEIKNKMQQIFMFNKENHIENHPKIYIHEFYETMLGNSLKKKNLFLNKFKTQNNLLKNPLSKNRPNLEQLKKFNILEGLFENQQNLLKEKENKQNLEINNQTFTGVNPEDFSFFLKEKRIKLEISHIKAKEEIFNDKSFSQISQLLTKQKKQIQNYILPQKSNQITIRKNIKRNDNSSSKNPISVISKQSILNLNQINKSNSLNNNKIKNNESQKGEKHITQYLPLRIQITPSHNSREKKMILTERNTNEKTPKKGIRSTEQSPNNVYNRFFIIGKYGKKDSSTEDNSKKMKTLKSDYFIKKPVIKKECLKTNQDLNDEYFMLSERKTYNEFLKTESSKFNSSS